MDDVNVVGEDCVLSLVYRNNEFYERATVESLTQNARSRVF